MLHVVCLHQDELREEGHKGGFHFMCRAHTVFVNVLLDTDESLMALRACRIVRRSI